MSDHRITGPEGTTACDRIRNPMRELHERNVVLLEEYRRCHSASDRPETRPTASPTEQPAERQLSESQPASPPLKTESLSPSDLRSEVRKLLRLAASLLA